MYNIGYKVFLELLRVNCLTIYHSILKFHEFLCFIFYIYDSLKVWFVNLYLVKRYHYSLHKISNLISYKSMWRSCNTLNTIIENIPLCFVRKWRRNYLNKNNREFKIFFLYISQTLNDTRKIIRIKRKYSNTTPINIFNSHLDNVMELWSLSEIYWFNNSRFRAATF